MFVLTLCNAHSLGVHVVDNVDDQSFSGWQEEDPDSRNHDEEEGEDLREEEEEKEEEEEECSKDSSRQLALIYSLQLAEAIIAASLQPQLYMLLRDSGHCGSTNAAYWTGLVEAIFALGSIAGLFWGKLGDRCGRRPIALSGMLGLFLSCIAMGFTSGVIACTIIRLFAGLMSSGIRAAFATMVGDVSGSKKAKIRNFAKLPLISTGGVIGPLLQAALAHRFAEKSVFWQRFPILSSQLACASLMFGIFAVNLVFLKETLPRLSDPGSDEEKQFLAFSPRRGSESSDEFGEHDAFLGQPRNVVVEGGRLKPITISEIVRAPSLMILLCSFSFLCLHSASFDLLLPLLGNSPTEHGGLGLPCSFIALVLFASISAGVVISMFFGKSVKRMGLLQLYRLCCWVFPVIYIATPLLSNVAQGSRPAIILSSGLSIFTKTLATGFARTLVLVLVTNASPDPFSLATIMGFMQSASVFRSLAVGGTAVAFSLSDDLSIQATNYGLWSTMAVVSFGGAAVAYFVMDRPRAKDYQSSLKWEVCYDSTEDLGWVGAKSKEL